MGSAENLQRIVDRQKEILTELEAECDAIRGSDLVRDNAALAAEVERLRENSDSVGVRARELEKENAGLKNALHEQLYSEKVKIVNATKQKLDVYFRSGADGELDRLTFIERGVMSRVDGMRETLEQNNTGINDSFHAKLDALSDELDAAVTESRAGAERLSDSLASGENLALDALQGEPLTEEQAQEIVKRNNFERFVGLNILNTIGVLLLLIGAITLARFTYTKLPVTAKGVMLFALGTVMLAGGEALNRRKPTVFSLGISAGGVGILYAALATSYFILHILSAYPALAVCVLITAAAFLLSIRYDSQTVASLTLIGGYLPVLTMGSDPILSYGAMVYFLALNLFALLISYGRKWRVAMYLGLILNIVGMLVLFSRFIYGPFLYQGLASIVFATLSFLIYTAIPVLGAYGSRARFKAADIVALAINTVVGSLVLFALFYNYNLQDFDGALAVVLSVVYLALGRIVEVKWKVPEKRARALFYLTGLAFAVLIIPLQFGRAWLSLGWLAEGVFLATYGVLYNDRRLRRAGTVIGSLCLFAFIFFDLAFSGDLFAFKYLSITLGSLIILGALMYKRMTSGEFARVYKIAALANAWFYSMYLILRHLWLALYNAVESPVVGLAGTWSSTGYLAYATAAVATFALAYVYPRIKLLRGAGTKALSTSLYVIGILGTLFVNGFLSPVDRAYFRAGTTSVVITIVGTVILLALGALSVFAMRDMMRTISSRTPGSALSAPLSRLSPAAVSLRPLIVSGYASLILTQNLIAQYGLSFSNAAITVIYVLIALAWIVYGFSRRLSTMRFSGLGLAILSVIKLFLIDLWSLTEGFRIVSYFALGVTLLAISFVYQYFNKRLKSSGAGAAGEAGGVGVGAASSGDAGAKGGAGGSSVAGTEGSGDANR